MDSMGDTQISKLKCSTCVLTRKGTCPMKNLHFDDVIYKTATAYIDAFLECGGRIIVEKFSCNFYPATSWSVSDEEREAWQHMGSACLQNRGRHEHQQIWKSTVSKYEASKFLQCSIPEIDILVDAGAIGSISFWKQIRIHKDSLDHYLNEGEMS